MKHRAKVLGPDSEPAHLIDMLIPLTPKQASERHTEFGGTDDTRFKWADRGHHYTCRHWDEETRLCTDYENRPPMCSNFPYGREDGCPFGCSHKGEPFGTEEAA